MKHFLTLFACLVTLSACGFQPLHGQSYQQSLNVDLAAIAVTVKGSNGSTTNTIPLPARYSELLKAEIEDGVNPEGQRAEKLFLLEVNFIETDVSLFVNPDGTASRGDLICSSSYTITRRADHKIVASGGLSRTSSYNTSPTADYASFVSREDARKRGIIELAQDYRFRLAALLPTLNNPNASAIMPAAETPDTTLQPDHSNETLRAR